MRTYRLVLALVLLVLVLTGAYTAFMYVYTEQKFTLPELLTEPSDYTVGTSTKQILFLHLGKNQEGDEHKQYIQPILFAGCAAFKIYIMVFKNIQKIFVNHNFSFQQLLNL